jgi:hypothetical protein
VVESRDLSLGHRVVQLNLLEFKVIVDGVLGRECPQQLDKNLHVIERLV